VEVLEAKVIAVRAKVVVADLILIMFLLTYTHVCLQVSVLPYMNVVHGNLSRLSSAMTLCPSSNMPPTTTSYKRMVAIWGLKRHVALVLVFLFLREIQGVVVASCMFTISIAPVTDVIK
jgi:hypothetical protein